MVAAWNFVQAYATTYIKKERDPSPGLAPPSFYLSCYFNLLIYIKLKKPNATFK